MIVNSAVTFGSEIEI